jgi:hypothetical protein
MQRWRIEIEACADEMEFPDDTAQDVIDYALKERAHEMCEEIIPIGWRILDKRGLNPVPKRFK